jgi:multiple sugar transport system permease protein
MSLFFVVEQTSRIDKGWLSNSIGLTEPVQVGWRVIWSMRSFFENAPRALEEAAWIDGAGFWRALFSVVLPTAVPGLAATAILCFVFSWNVLTRTSAMTAPVAVVNFMNYAGWEWGRIAAGGTMVMLPVLVFSLAVRRFLVNGLTAGAVKG